MLDLVFERIHLLGLLENRSQLVVVASVKVDWEL
jgi:hypothetical protein